MIGKKILEYAEHAVNAGLLGEVVVTKAAHQGIHAGVDLKTSRCCESGTAIKQLCSQLFMPRKFWADVKKVTGYYLKPKSRRGL